MKKVTDIPSVVKYMIDNCKRNVVVCVTSGALAAFLRRSLLGCKYIRSVQRYYGKPGDIAWQCAGESIWVKRMSLKLRSPLGSGSTSFFRFLHQEGNIGVLPDYIIGLFLKAIMICRSKAYCVE